MGIDSISFTIPIPFKTTSKNFYKKNYYEVKSVIRYYEFEIAKMALDKVKPPAALQVEFQFFKSPMGPPQCFAMTELLSRAITKYSRYKIRGAYFREMRIRVTHKPGTTEDMVSVKIKSLRRSSNAETQSE